MSITQPVSKRKLEANRANAQLSCGPVTPAGKQIVSQNNLRHGLTGTFRMMPYEDPKLWKQVLDGFLAAEQPANDVELALVVKMAQHYWLAQRALRLQDGCFLDVPAPGSAGAGPDEVVIRINGAIENYMRYHTVHDRAFERASRELRARRKETMQAQRGFESQKRAEAQEQRRIAAEQRRINEEKRRAENEKRKAEKHPLERKGRGYAPRSSEATPLFLARRA